jgi:hypothetical protein
MKRTCLSLLFLLFVSQALAQPESEPAVTEAGDTESLDLFDGDVEDTSLGWSRLALSLGYMFLNADGQYRIGLPNGREVTVLDLDRLGVDDDDTSHWLALTWRSDKSRWGAWFGSWQYDSAGYRVWEDELDLGDGLYIPVGAGITSEIDTKWYILEATYSFWRTKNFDAGIGIGLHMVDIDTRMTGRVSVGNQDFEAINEQLDLLAPLPNILGYAYWKFADRWRLITRYGWFDLTYGDYSGQMINLHALLRYELSERWEIEAGYQFVKLDLDIEQKNYTSKFDIDYSGPIAAVRFSF